VQDFPPQRRKGRKEFVQHKPFTVLFLYAAFISIKKNLYTVDFNKETVLKYGSI
jgi:hypothetical protein